MDNVNMYRILILELRRGNHFANLGVDVQIIVKLILKKQGDGWRLDSVASG
jgi:hypothetical protein